MHACNRMFQCPVDYFSKVLNLICQGKTDVWLAGRASSSDTIPIRSTHLQVLYKCQIPLADLSFYLRLHISIDSPLVG